MRYIDLYHKTSSPMWYNIDTGFFITGPQAVELKKSAMVKVGFCGGGKTDMMKAFSKEIPGWNVPTLIYGEIFSTR